MISNRENTRAVLANLRSQYPDSAFLALGQTIWWDEPMKAVLLHALDQWGLGGNMVLGVHDTDYFARLNGRSPEQRFEMLAHNDGSTRDLWSAAGEISRLFGSETIPRRSDLIKHGSPFGKVAHLAPEGAQEFHDTVTEAWGWRGLVDTGSRDLIVHFLLLAEMGDSLDRLLDYGFSGTLESIVSNCCREEATRRANAMLAWVAEYRAENPDGALNRLFQYAIPKIYEMLLGKVPQNIETACSAHLLLLNPETASLPRFQFVDLFLNEKTRTLARDAYNNAVAGSEMYTLDQFGLGAIPFDVITPQHGRGTLRVTLRAIHIESREPQRIPLKKPINSIHELAEILVETYGDHVSLVGKAVTLISMLAQEFIFVFNEEGSAYVRRTRKMNDRLISAGIEMDLRPLLRLKYSTWDSLEGSNVTFGLPEHLASAFGQETITSKEFAPRWREVTAQQSDLLTTLRKTLKPRQLMELLAEVEGGIWSQQLSVYEEYRQSQQKLVRAAKLLQEQIDSLYLELGCVKRRLQEAQNERGAHFRSVTEWAPDDEACRESYGATIAELLKNRQRIISEIVHLKSERLGIERGDEMTALRNQSEALEYQAERRRIDLIRNAILTRDGLVHTNNRPCAWWLPMVDPSGAWFGRVADTFEAYLEPLSTVQSVRSSYI